jgi:hypothetical protein
MQISPQPHPLSGSEPPLLRPVPERTLADPPTVDPTVLREQLELRSKAPAAQTALTFVEGHAPTPVTLTPAQRQQLDTLIQRFPDLRAPLEQLASGPSPRLLARDSRGQSVLDHLGRLAEGHSKLKGVDPARVLREWLPRLQDRQTIFQGPQYTCGSAALQNWMMGNQPGELTRLVTDLTLTGKTRLADQTSLKLPPDLDTYLEKRRTLCFNNGKDSDQRALCDLLFQSAVMQDISLVGGNRAWKGEANSLGAAALKGLAWLTDWAGYDPAGDDVGLMARLRGDGGGDPLLLHDLSKGMSGKGFRLETFLSGEAALHAGLSRMAREGKEGLVLYKSPLHYVLLKNYDPATRMVTCLSTGTYNSHEDKIPLAQFLQNCGALILPE